MGLHNKGLEKAPAESFPQIRMAGIRAGRGLFEDSLSSMPCGTKIDVTEFDFSIPKHAPNGGMFLPNPPSWCITSWARLDEVEEIVVDAYRPYSDPSP
jgi:hypothetical protein